MVSYAGQWPWSSYRATTCMSQPPKWLNVEWLLASFGQCKNNAIRRYKKYVSEGKGQPSPWSELRNQVYLGNEEFVVQLQGLIDGDKELSEIPSSQRRPMPLPLDEYELLCNNRNSAIIKAYESGGYTQKEIGNYFHIHYSRVSKIIKMAKGKT